MESRNHVLDPYEQLVFLFRMILYRTQQMNSDLLKSRMPLCTLTPMVLASLSIIDRHEVLKSSAPATTLTARHMLLVSLDA